MKSMNVYPKEPEKQKPGDVVFVDPFFVVGNTSDTKKVNVGFITEEFKVLSLGPVSDQSCKYGFRR